MLLSMIFHFSSAHKSQKGATNTAGRTLLSDPRKEKGKTRFTYLFNVYQELEENKIESKNKYIKANSRSRDIVMNTLR